MPFSTKGLFWGGGAFSIEIKVDQLLFRFRSGQPIKRKVQRTVGRTVNAAEKVQYYLWDMTESSERPRREIGIGLAESLSPPEDPDLQRTGEKSLLSQIDESFTTEGRGHLKKMLFDFVDLAQTRQHQKLIQSLLPLCP